MQRIDEAKEAITFPTDQRTRQEEGVEYAGDTIEQKKSRKTRASRVHELHATLSRQIESAATPIGRSEKNCSANRRNTARLRLRVYLLANVPTAHRQHVLTVTSPLEASRTRQFDTDR